MPAAAPTTWEDYARRLGESLQAERRSAGLTQENLAHSAGMTRTHYQQIERGLWKPGAPANPTVKVVARLAQELGVAVGDLLPDVSAIVWAD
jgi:transcriptional regulator with XRE-family HTH domain